MSQLIRSVRRVMVCLCLAATAVQAGVDGGAYDVKASYLLNLVHFTDWPSDAFDGAVSPLRICVAEPDPFEGALTRTLRGDRVGPRPIVIAHPLNPSDLRGCHVLFVPEQARPSDVAWLRATNSAPMLTVGETPAFEAAGGLVTFVSDGGRVRSDVNRGHAEQLRLRFSARFLETARRVF